MKNYKGQLHNWNVNKSIQCEPFLELTWRVFSVFNPSWLELYVAPCHTTIITLVPRTNITICCLRITNVALFSRPSQVAFANTSWGKDTCLSVRETENSRHGNVGTAFQKMRVFNASCRRTGDRSLRLTGTLQDYEKTP